MRVCVFVALRTVAHGGGFNPEKLLLFVHPLFLCRCHVTAGASTRSLLPVLYSGFGFVKMKTKEAAAECVDKLSGYVCSRHASQDFFVVYCLVFWIVPHGFVVAQLPLTVACLSVSVLVLCTHAIVSLSFELDGRTIRVELARRGSAHASTPGQCLWTLPLPPAVHLGR